MTVVSPFTQLRDKWNLDQKWHVKFSSEFCSTARAKQFVALAIVTGEPRHVLNDSANGEVDFLCHRSRQACNFLCSFLWRCYNKHFSAWQVLAKAQCNVACAWWHVDQQVIRFIPEHISKKLFKRFVQHWSAPNNCFAFRHKITNRNATNPVVLWR